MNKLNRFLLMLIAMAAILLAAVGIDRGMEYFEQRKWKSEREVIFEESRADIAVMQSEIQTLSEDPTALIAFMEENGLNYVESYGTERAWQEDGIYGENGAAFSEWESGMPDGDFGEEMQGVSQNEMDRISVSGGNMLDDGGFPSSVSDHFVSGNQVSQYAVSGNAVTGDTALENMVSGNSISGNSISGNTISGNTVSSNTVSGNSISENSVSGSSLVQKELCASYENTMKINRMDKWVIADSDIDFSDKKITCLGDSITAAANLEDIEDYLQLSYPYQLGQILGAEEVVNLGIGGSSIGRYWSDAFVDRYRDIPEDTDIIIIMGGTNDGFAASQTELGSLDERKKETFAGDLDELLRKLKEDYPDADIILVTPLSNVLHDMLRKERDYLLPQSAFVRVMEELADEYDVPVVNLYGSNFLDSHDAAVIYNFIPDGVHGNALGYRVLAEHIAAELIRILEEEKEAQTGTAEEVKTAGTTAAGR